MAANTKFKVDAGVERRVAVETGTKNDEIVRSMVEPFCSKRLLGWIEQIQCEGILLKYYSLQDSFVYKKE